MSRIVGIDVGGANLKYADLRGNTWRRRFPLWRCPASLGDAIREDLGRFAPADSLAVTMTGELADCFADRAVGVGHIVDEVTRAVAGDAPRFETIAYYGVDGRFHDAPGAIENPDLVAASNWHALAAEVARTVIADGWLIDVGSTTTDIVPLAGGRVVTDAKTDHERLAEGSLVYVGCRRTPVCALAQTLAFLGRQVQVMNERFATMDDVGLVLGWTPEAPDDHDTADGQARTRAHAVNRLARMVGLDRRHVDDPAARALAAQVMRAARQRIHDGLMDMAIKYAASGTTASGATASGATDAGRSTWVLSGHGQALAPIPGGRPTIDLRDLWGHRLSRAAPSFAVARQLARESGAVPPEPPR